MLVPMLPDHITVTLDLCPRLWSEAPFHIGPGQMHDPHVPVHCLVATHTKVCQAQPCFQVEIGHLARPARAVTLQGLGSRASEIRTEEVRRGFRPGVSFGKKDADIEGYLGQPSARV